MYSTRPLIENSTSNGFLQSYGQRTRRELTGARRSISLQKATCEVASERAVRCWFLKNIFLNIPRRHIFKRTSSHLPSSFKPRAASRALFCTSNFKTSRNVGQRKLTVCTKSRMYRYRRGLWEYLCCIIKSFRGSSVFCVVAVGIVVLLLLQ